MIKWIVLIIVGLFLFYVIDTVWEMEKKEYRDKERWGFLSEEEQKKRWENRKRYD